MKKLIYVAGAYSKGDVMVNIRNAILAADKLFEKGYIPFVPHLTGFWHIVSPKPHETWLEIDQVILERCDSIYMLRDWEHSKGARKEWELAKELELEMFYEDDELR